MIRFADSMEEIPVLKSDEIAMAEAIAVQKGEVVEVIDDNTDVIDETN